MLSNLDRKDYINIAIGNNENVGQLFLNQISTRRRRYRGNNFKTKLEAVEAISIGCF